eukprot:8575047-Ditylum_brightwellii.AAC.1
MFDIILAKVSLRLLSSKDDARAPTFTFIYALTIDTMRYIAVARTFHEIQRFNVSVEFGNQGLQHFMKSL